MRYCKDCKWYDDSWGVSCTNPRYAKLDPVHGPRPGYPETLRNGGACGPNGEGWEQHVGFLSSLMRGVLGARAT
jgi:hypothetical protein